MSSGAAIAQRARTFADPASPVELVRVAVPGGQGELPPDVAQLAPPTPVQTIPVVLDAEPPPNVAILNVVPSDTRVQEGYEVFGSRAGMPFSAPQSSVRPRIALAELAQDVDLETSQVPSRIIGVINEWSTENRATSHWLRDHVDAVADLRVLIIDHTGYELPWELLTLFPRERGERKRYLGAAAVTARWQWVMDNELAEDVMLDCGEVLLAGSALAFVDRANLAGGGPEFAALEAMGVTPADSLGALVDTLRDEVEGLSLVYVATHGTFGASALELTMGCGDDEHELTVLRSDPLEAVRSSGAIVFLNVCHGGRMLKEHVFVPTERLRGFPELFLGHGATGVIAATGWVDDEYAAELAEWAFLRLATGETVSVPELLRDWRAEAFRALPRPATERERLRLLTAFMYVYYGNPLAQVRIDA